MWLQAGRNGKTFPDGAEEYNCDNRRIYIEPHRPGNLLLYIEKIREIAHLPQMEEFPIPQRRLGDGGDSIDISLF